jgi:outer membrane lipoprotein-sorting protein
MTFAKLESSSWLAAMIALGPACIHTCAQISAQREISEKQIFSEVIAHNQIRSDALVEYLATRVYRVSDPDGKIHAQEEGRMEFHAPDMKRFVVISEQGSEIVRRLALSPLIASEIKAAAGKDRHDSAVSPDNYGLELIGEEDVRSYHCYVLRAIPKRVDKYLFEGKVWIDKQDFAVVRIEGGRQTSCLSGSNGRIS